MTEEVIPITRSELVEAIYEAGIKHSAALSEQAADNILAELEIARRRRVDSRRDAGAA